MNGSEQAPTVSTSVSMVDVKDIAKPLEKLIEAVSMGIGKIYEPTAIVRKAKAEAEAGSILARAKAEQDEIAYRAAQRITFLERRRQTNIESIITVAKKELPPSVAEKPVNEDWIVQFFQQAQDVSEAEMQRLWAKVLAGEVSEPGTFSKRTLERMRTLDRADAELFTKLCRTLWRFEDGFQFRMNSESAEPFDALAGIDVYGVNRLASVGLISSKDIWYSLEKTKAFSVVYGSVIYTLFWPGGGAPAEHDPPIIPRPFMVTPLTDVGSELARIVSWEPLPAFGKTVTDAIAKDYGMELTIERIK